MADGEASLSLAHARASNGRSKLVSNGAAEEGPGSWSRAVRAADIMTPNVVTASPATTLRDLARLLVAHGVSAIPIIDESRTVLGIVSERDLIRRDEDTHREQRRHWWLMQLAEGEELHEDFIANLASL